MWVTTDEVEMFDDATSGAGWNPENHPGLDCEWYG